MFAVSRPIGRLPFLFAVSTVNSLLLLAVLLAFTFMPSGAGHMAVLVIIAAFMGWWFSLHARRFVGAGRGLFWPLMAALVCFGTFAMSYAIIAALWSVPEVQQEAFRTGGSDYTRHIETSALVVATGKWLAGWAGAAGSIALTGFLAMLMGLVALGSCILTFAAMLLPSGMSAPLLRSMPPVR